MSLKYVSNKIMQFYYCKEQNIGFLYKKSIKKVEIAETKISSSFQTVDLAIKCLLQESFP